MELGIEEHVDCIIQTRSGREQSNHIWLYGFHYFINNSLLDFTKIKKYLEQKLQEYPKFARFKSSVQLLKLIEYYSKGFNFRSPVPLHKINISDTKLIIKKLQNFPAMPELVYFHLPINDNYHLEFPLIKENNKCKFIYTSCQDCEELEEHGFPEITLRQSINFNEDKEAQESMRKGTFMYDNRVSVNHQDRETMIESYEAFKDFIEATRIN